MADEQYKWLNRETAEHLLRGESLEAVDAAAREQAERLAKALGALSPDTTPADAELPGEEAALAAFRKAREATAAEELAVGHGDESAVRRTGRSSDVGLVRIGSPSRAARRPRWARPARLGLAAVLAVGMVGGVAVAAGTGALPTPFGDEKPGPGASVSAAVTPDRPAGSPSRDNVQGGTSGTPTPSDTAGGYPSAGSSRDAAGKDGGDGRSTDERGTPGTADGTGTWGRSVAEACRDIRDGKTLGSDRRRALEGAAGGSARVWKYCRAVLEAAADAAGQDDEGKGDDGDGRGDRGDQGDRDGRDGRGRHHHGGGNDHHQDGGVGLPAPTAFAPQRPTGPDRTPLPSPSPTYSAL
ncbi:hypothetical protein [Streptomyces herbicida]|uniref:hypothetical protein n=1 Tax=Streptomyces herbicida TaxID=3065675 RepID=UPI00292D1F57|nr:hypothetical protein [Streptomyces sp. NEAU-HV9]